MPQLLTAVPTLQTVGQTVEQSNTFSLGTPVYQAADGLWYAAQADDLARLKHGVVAQPTATGFTVIRKGELIWTAHGLTVGAQYYLSPTTPGAIQSVAPSLPGVWVQLCYQVLDAQSVLVLDQEPHPIEAPVQEPRGSLYNLVAATAAAYPGTGNVRLNQANPATVTALYLAAADSLGSADPQLAYLATGDDLYFWDGLGNGYLYQVDAMTLNGALGNYWYDVTVSNFRAAGVTIAPLPTAVRVLGVKTTPTPPEFIGMTDTPASYAGMGNRLVRVNAAAQALEFVVDDKVPESRAVNTATGLSGGGNLSANRTLNAAFHNFPTNTSPATNDYFVWWSAVNNTHYRAQLTSLAPTQRNTRSVAVIGNQLSTLSNDFSIEITNAEDLHRIQWHYDGQVLFLRYRSGGAVIRNNRGNNGVYRQIQPAGKQDVGHRNPTPWHPLILVFNYYWGKWFMSYTQIHN